MAEYSLDCTFAQDVARKLDAFTLAYVEAAMWTLTDDDGGSLDYLGLHDIAAETIARAVADCAQFQAAYSELLALAGSPAQNGHDFWLTRNGHGAGFWDRGYPDDLGRALTDAAHGEGSADWYLADNGEVFQF
jgi:hypothetical protein